MRNALVGLKYRRDATLGIAFAGKLAALIEREGWQVDGIVPIPLARQRTLERGYNQVEVFSAALAHYLGCRQGNGWLRRVRETRSQVGLDVGARKENMQSAFVAAGHMVAGKSLVLMDDVMTTGATLDSAAQALKRAGASKVYGLTIARAMSTKSDDLI